MKRSSDYLMPFFAAISIHAAGGYYAGTFLLPRLSVITPQFQAGESSVELTLLSPPAPPPEMQEPEPVIEEALIEDSIPMQVIEEKEDVIREEPQPMDADMEEKGVEGKAVAQSYVRPKYPYGSKIRGEEGSVLVCGVLDENGRALDVRVIESSGYRALDNSAVKAMKETHFVSENSGTIQGHEVECRFSFKLTD